MTSYVPAFLDSIFPGILRCRSFNASASYLRFNSSYWLRCDLSADHEVNELARQFSALPEIGTGLSRRFRSAHAFVVKPGSVEAANASLSRREHGAGILDPSRARLWLLGRADPVDPIPARVGRDVRPQRPRLRRGGRESFSKICRYRRFRCRRRYLERDNVARVCACSLAQLPVHFEPVTFLAVWLELGLKRDAIDSAFDCRHATRRELRTGGLWQDEKRPGVGVIAQGGRLHSGRKSFALKRIEVLVTLLGITD